MAQPRWREIADELLRRIEEGDFAREEGSGRRQLPPEMDLREEYGASRNTIRDAITWLASRGHVVSEQGKGTFVVFRPAPFHVTLSARGDQEGPGGGEGEAYRQDAMVQKREPRDLRPKVEVQGAKPKIARYLQIPPESLVVSRHQERYIDDDPWSLQTSYYPLEFVHRGALRLLEAYDLQQGVVKYLGETLGYKQAGYHDEVKARVPDENETRFFDLMESAADVVLETFRTAYDPDGAPFRLTVTVWPADRNRLHYNVGEVPGKVVESPGETHHSGEDGTE